MDIYNQIKELCPHDQFCGGCIYQGISYEEQLDIKEKEVLKLLEDKEVAVECFEHIQASPSLYSYRNKMEYTFGDFVKDGPTTLGMHQKGKYMSIITVDQCQLVPEDFNTVLAATLKFCEKYSKYHKKSHKGLLRNLIVRCGINTEEILVNIVTASDSEEEQFDVLAYTTMLLDLPLKKRIVGILRTINDSLADAVIPESVHLLWGRDYYMERIADLDFKVSAFSFFQTNVKAVERLYLDALDLLDDYNGKNVFDLFCGAGTITQILAKKALHVTGVEIVEDAVESAKANAKLNNLENCTFIQGDVFDVISNLDTKPDTIVVDPPRVGISEKALDKIIEYGVDQIVYISCNPKTLVQNLYYFQYYGYKVKYLKPYDNFPWTKHIEVVTLLVKER